MLLSGVLLSWPRPKPTPISSQTTILFQGPLFSQTTRFVSTESGRPYLSTIILSERFAQSGPSGRAPAGCLWDPARPTSAQPPHSAAAARAANPNPSILFP